MPKHHIQFVEVKQNFVLSVKQDLQREMTEQNSLEQLVHMHFSAYESRSSQRKKATAKADALRAVIVKTKPLIQSLVCL